MKTGKEKNEYQTQPNCGQSLGCQPTQFDVKLGYAK